jgi:Flp pilus assembly protein TadD
MIIRPRRFPLIALLLMAILATAVFIVYLAGIKGPYVFDDFSNIIDNSYIAITSLDKDSLYHAAYSVRSGVLWRPVAMVSFALNHYFAGGFGNPAPFKLTNIVIHAINALLVFWLLRLILARYAHISHEPEDRKPLTPVLLGAAIALLWAVHPIQLTSVLYVVQRMVGLSALFTLLGIVCYLIGRQRQLAGKKGGVWLMLAGPLGFGALGMLSKENAILLIGFIALLEFTLFADERPWRFWKRLPANLRWTLIGALALALVAATAYAISYSLPGYAVRDYTMMERVLTQTRVLFFYLSLIVLPRINQFSLHHEFNISTSLLTPWTTLPSLLGLIALMAAGFAARKRLPLLSLGILWFFVAHALESTIFNLELAHEHRNYLASLGILLAAAQLVVIIGRRYTPRLPWILLPSLIMLFAVTTFLRSQHWSSTASLALHEAGYRPDSAYAQTDLGFALAGRGQAQGSIQAMRRAAELNPNDPAPLINMHMLAALMRVTLDPQDQEETLRRLSATSYVTANTSRALQSVNACLLSDCSVLAPHMEQWARTLIKVLRPTADRSIFNFMLGRALRSQGKTNEAILALVNAVQQDKKYLHPLFELAAIYMDLGQINAAETILAHMREINSRSAYPRDREIEKLANRILTLKKTSAEGTISP